MTYYLTACCKTPLAEASEGMPWQVGGDELEGRWRDRVGP